MPISCCSPSVSINVEYTAGYGKRILILVCEMLVYMQLGYKQKGTKYKI